MERSPKLIHYEQEFMFDDNDFIDSYPLFYKPNSRQMVRVTQGILGLKKKRLAEYFRDCPSLIQSINTGEIIYTEGVFQHYIDLCDEETRNKNTCLTPIIMI